MDKINKTDQEWKEELDDETYHVTREGGTEKPFTGKYHDHKEEGVYTCSNCKTELFNSGTKFDSKSGWPSFDDPVNLENVNLIEDKSLGMTRTEVRCAKCDAHLGHVFEDGPRETTGKRYCINSCSLSFNRKE